MIDAVNDLLKKYPNNEILEGKKRELRLFKKKNKLISEMKTEAI